MFIGRIRQILEKKILLLPLILLKRIRYFMIIVANPAGK